MVKRKWFDLGCIILTILLILIDIAALCGYWYNEGSVLVLISAVLLLIASVIRYRGH